MEKLCDIITTLAVIAFVLGMCTIEGNPVGSVIMMTVGGAWLVWYGFMEKEKQRERGRW